ncbi:glycosyltransferase family 2 protein [Planctomicrobium piriforme]|uniref:Dolichol-phosphate mannosyltransferase n=1 Tax=Planctomicrobium piriforme TaxID=1576369 RepID=A0A1I3FSV3_9PLAN|nr:glycosyltransferase family 2 protein [Planctomicrobium piriforme]SFI14316.1 dolichol-phosphate mannosyltransferase [Planctomicrobium piriforme]
MSAMQTSTLLRPADPLISVVLPAYNESAVLRELQQRISAVLQGCGQRFEIVFVNDGSTDGSYEILDSLAAEHSEVRVLHFSRNFGHQAAVQAGLAYAAGDAVIIMDSDLQDDPAAITAFLDQWQQGQDVVYAVRHGRKENAVKRFLFYAFYRVLNAISNTPIPMDAGNFGLLDRAVVNELIRISDRDRYFPGLRSWVGYRQIGVPVERLRRHDDQPRVSMKGLFRLAKTAIFSFSTVPLSAFYVLALLSLASCIAVSGFTLYHKLFTGLAIPGWTSLTIVASFFGALNAFGIGILGEYTVRIYDQVRARPPYLVARAVNFARPSQTGNVDALLERLSDQWTHRADPGQTPEAEEGLTALGFRS